MIAKHYKPQNTCWKHKTVREIVKIHKRACRRAYKQYLKSGDNRHLEASNRLLTDWDFD